MRPHGSPMRARRANVTSRSGTWLTDDLAARPTPRLELNICWAEFAEISRNLPGGRASKLE